MTRTTLLATIAAAMALTSGQALAEGYLGTYGREQDNANAVVAQASESLESQNQRPSRARSYGAPIETGTYLTDEERPAAAPDETNSGVYLGTGWHYQDNADANTRF